MDNQSFLIFKVQDLRYAIAARQVREVLKLPALMPATNMPADVIGILNYRGQVLPVMHLAQRFGHMAPNCRVSDSLIVVESQGLTVGMVVQGVEDVSAIETSAIQLGFSLERDMPVKDVFLAGIATVDEQMIMLLNPETLIREADAIAQVTAEQSPEDGELSSDSSAVARQTTGHQPVDFFERYCPTMTSGDREILRQRTAVLHETLDDDEDSNLRSIAVMRLGEEYFGLDLDTVREFIQVSNVTPVPCCPSHIIGNMNLRGEVMTLIDIRSALNVSSADTFSPETADAALDAPSESSQSEQQTEQQKAIVVDVDGVVAGIPVDRLLDIVYVSPDSIAPVPVATTSARQDYFSGIATHEEMMLSILDFPKLLATENLVVNETV